MPEKPRDTKEGNVIRPDFAREETNQIDDDVVRFGFGKIVEGPWSGTSLEPNERTLYTRYQNIVDRLTAEITRLKKLQVSIDEAEKMAGLVEEFEQLLKSANMWWDKLKNKQLTTNDDMHTLESVASHMEKQLNSWDLEKPEHKE